MEITVSPASSSCSKRCCSKCRHFEQRSGFCRKNPPQNVTVIDGESIYYKAMFPKISMPDIDFCDSFDER